MQDSPVRTIKAWECAGCGRIEAPQPCLGICQDHAIELIHGETHAAVVAERDRLMADNAAMRELVLRLARTVPRDAQWERDIGHSRSRHRHFSTPWNGTAPSVVGRDYPFTVRRAPFNRRSIFSRGIGRPTL